MTTRNSGTGSIRQRSSNSYSVRYYGPPDPSGRRKQVEESVKGTRKTAERVLRERLSALDTGDFITKKKATVKQFLDRWLEEYVTTNLSEKTEQGYRQVINCYTGEISNRQVQS